MESVTQPICQWTFPDQKEAVCQPIQTHLDAKLTLMWDKGLIPPGYLTKKWPNADPGIWQGIVHTSMQN